MKDTLNLEYRGIDFPESDNFYKTANYKRLLVTIQHSKNPQIADRYLEESQRKF